MIVGPIFHRELATVPRRLRLYVDRTVYATGLVILISTAWAVMSGSQVLRSVGDLARFGLILFDILAPLQLALILFYASVRAAANVAQEKDKQTLVLLMMTRLNNAELVIGKLFASLLHVMVLILAGLPIFALVILFGGVSVAQLVRVFAVTTISALMAGSLGTLIALWREKTFQTLALVALVLFVWLGFWEAVHAGWLGTEWWGVSTPHVANAFHPLRAVQIAARPAYSANAWLWHTSRGNVSAFLVMGTLISVLLCSIAILRIRVWNPSRQHFLGPQEDDSTGTIWSDKTHDDAESSRRAEAARATHVDARVSTVRPQTSRAVWDNPILWRELCTWAYGRKVLLVRIVYLVLVGVAAVAIWRDAATAALAAEAVVPLATRLLVPVFLLSLVILNAVAVTSVTTERDGRCIDLLLATDLSPREFYFGKLFGVLGVAGLMVLAPMALVVVVWMRRELSTENLLYVLVGLAVMDLFVAALGIHCGTRYANSRAAIGVSLGTVFALFLGVVTCMLMMISFSGSFQVQMAPFLAFIVGGGVSMYVALGAGNPSSAMAAAAMVVPFATFHAITSFMLGQYLGAFLVIACAYGFATAAMLIPALSEFDFATARTAVADT